MTQTTDRESGIFYGWFVLGGLFVIAAFGPMGRYILTVLFPFIMEDPGWSRQTIGLAFTLHFWAYALLAVATGGLLDVMGGRFTIMAGGLLTLTGLMLLSAVKEIWQFFIIYGIVMAAAVAMTHFVPNTALVRKWFIRKAGLATGIVTVGTVTGFAVLPPLISYLSASLGWRTACFMCAFGFGALIMITGLLVIRNTPESMGLRPDGEGLAGGEETSADPGDNPGTVAPPSGEGVRAALRTGNFWCFFIAYAVTGIPLQGILGHVIIWGVEMGYPSASSGMIMVALTLPSIPVRVIAGWMGDRLGKKRILIFFNLYALLVWFLGWVIIRDRWTFLLFCVLLGFAYSAPFSLYTPFLGDIFGRRIVGTLMGILTLGHGIIGGTGPYLWGWIADNTDSYIMNCPISAVCYGIVVLALFFLKIPGHEETPMGNAGDSLPAQGP
jgi:MFS family permease